jgi:3-deoxy-D-manno-octulosonic acid kinase
MNSLTIGDGAHARIAGGGMLYDASCLDHPEPHVFDVAYWREHGRVQETAGGRGAVTFITTPDQQRWVLRHYRRGGLVARWLDDRYLWTGEEATRGFREWRLLRLLREWQLPVPRPIAARYRREGFYYRADLVTTELPTRTTLASILRDAPLPAPRWRAIGACIGALHARGVHHADLNAHNLLLAEDGRVFVLDFDRGRIRPRGTWERSVLARLHRSLVKVTTGLPADRFDATAWHALEQGLAR